MKIHKNCKIEIATAKNKDRRPLREPFLDIADGKGTLVASDGRILAQIPVEIETADVAGYVSAEVLKGGRKATRGNDAHVLLNGGGATLDNGATMPRTGEAADSIFPNWRAVVPAKPVEPQIVIGIDALRLWQLAQAMGTQGVTITIETPENPFHVEPCNCGQYSDGAKPSNMDARGVIMPIKVA